MGPASQPGIGATQCHLLAVGRIAGKILWGGMDEWMGVGGRDGRGILSEDKYTSSSLEEGSTRGQMIQDGGWGDRLWIEQLPEMRNQGTASRSGEPGYSLEVW